MANSIRVLRGARTTGIDDACQRRGESQDEGLTREEEPVGFSGEFKRANSVPTSERRIPVEIARQSDPKEFFDERQENERSFDFIGASPCGVLVKARADRRAGKVKYRTVKPFKDREIGEKTTPTAKFR